MGTGKNKCLNSNLGLCMCIHEQNRKHQFVMVDPVGMHFDARRYKIKYFDTYLTFTIKTRNRRGVGTYVSHFERSKLWTT